MGGTTVKAPAPLNYFQQTADTLNAQVQLAPQLAAAEADWRPTYTALDLQSLQDYLLGTQGGTRTVNSNITRTANVTGYYGDDGTFYSNRQLQDDPTLRDRLNLTWRTAGTSWNTPTTSTINTPATRGYLDLYQNEIAPTLSALQAAADRQQREADVQAVEDFGGRTVQAILGANPQQKALLDALNQQAQQGLAAGGQPGFADATRTTQAVRSNWANRGLGQSAPAQLQEALNLYGAGESARQGRQQFGLQVANMNQAATGDPFMAILGRSSGVGQMALGYGQQATAGANNIGAKLFQPESQMANDLAMSNYQGSLAASTANASNRAGLYSGIAQGAGNIFGSFLGNAGLFSGGK